MGEPPGADARLDEGRAAITPAIEADCHARIHTSKAIPDVYKKIGGSLRIPPWASGGGTLLAEFDQIIAPPWPV